MINQVTKIPRWPKANRSFFATAVFSLLAAVIALPESVFAAPPPTPNLIPNNDGIVPGRLYSRQIGLQRVTYVGYHNGLIYTYNVGGGLRRIFQFQDLSNPGSLALIEDDVWINGDFSSAFTHGAVKTGNWLGHSIHRSGFGTNEYFGPMRPGLTHAQGAANINYWPWTTPFVWAQYGSSPATSPVRKLDQTIVDIDMDGLTGHNGYAVLLGNYMLWLADESGGDGRVSILDMSPSYNSGAQPNVVGSVPGAKGYLAAIWRDNMVIARKDGLGAQASRFQKINFSDPSNPVITGEVSLYDSSDFPADELNSWGVHVPYTQFQDEYG
ncbi:MAG: hypothetical protein F6K21_32885, partial [Symploca sp. SIO2D2]|nr:hypothetical protein [Symploca sp. SIO2D2]